MHRLKIEIDTQKDVCEFVSAVENVQGSVKIIGTDGDVECTCNAKSLLGMLYAMCWTDLSVESDSDIYERIKKFVV